MESEVAKRTMRSSVCTIDRSLREIISHDELSIRTLSVEARSTVDAGTGTTTAKFLFKMALGRHDGTIIIV